MKRFLYYVPVLLAVLLGLVLVAPAGAATTSYEAEAASLGGGVTVDSNHTGFFGTGFVNFPASGGFVQFNNADGGTGGNSTLRIRYALGVTASRTGLLLVNGASQSITFSPTGSWDTWAIQEVTMPLNSGTTNTLRFESNGQDLANLDQLEVVFGSGVTSTPTPGLIVKGYVREGSSVGPGLANVTIYRAFAAYSAVAVATTDANGYYESAFTYIPGDEMVTLFAQASGYTFTPVNYYWRHYYGVEIAERDFVATQGGTVTPSPTPTTCPAVMGFVRLGSSTGPGLAGVQVSGTASGVTIIGTTDSTGRYVLGGCGRTGMVVTPQLAGYIFTPAQQTYGGASLDFVATQPSGSVVYQAEAASFGGGVTIDSNNTGFLGTGYANFPLSGGFVQFNGVTGGTGGSQTLRIRYALGATTSRTGLLLVNGTSRNITFSPTGAWTSWATQDVVAPLNSGTTNTLRFESNGQDLANLDQIEIILSGGPTNTPTPTHTPTMTPTQPLGPISVEAEAGALAGAARIASCSTCSGGQKVGYIGNGSANYDTLTISASSAGSATLTIYAMVNGTRSFSVSVNGGADQTVSFTGTSYTIPITQSITISVNSGNNTIKFHNDTAYAPDLDRVTLGPISNCTPTAITPYIQTNSGSWVQTSTATVNVGDTVRFGPQPNDLNGWSWSGPNGFNATSREVTISNIQTSQAGNYVASYTNSGGCTSNQTFTITVNGNGNGFPARFSAPYQPTWTNPDLAALASSTGHKFWTLAFIINGPGTCNPLWNGNTSLSNTWNVSGLHSMGGDVIISFGGASGVEIAASCTDVSSTQAAYQKVINAMGAKAIDLDIESGYESNTASIDRRNKAMHNLQVANPGLRVDYTLAVDRSGLPSAQINLLKNAVSNGVTIGSVNIMAMDYGPCYSDMGQAAIDAANATRNQLAANGINAKVGVTPMIGVNDVTCEVFSTSDAQLLVNYAQSNTFINLLAYWSQDADGKHSYINIFKTFH